MQLQNVIISYRCVLCLSNYFNFYCPEQKQILDETFSTNKNTLAAPIVEHPKNVNFVHLQDKTQKFIAIESCQVDVVY